MDNLQALGEKLSKALQPIDVNGGSKNHSVKPIAAELSKTTNPWLTTFEDNLKSYRQQAGKNPVQVSMPLEMLLGLIGELPQLEQTLFWTSDVKRIEGIQVKLTNDGTLSFY
ncbi:conserved hypothetical protein [Vibrio nigripulchritudo SOn1]|uniref:Uncharacterized protein n=1 Tax=Vibrio nigripulchritudo SOn1 TaxID=1238450 RepID=A0AAV2VQ89_9VIBR|nr:hypothetical protein [Vibrio nigripulchritudo]CCO46717.1 conserved hypothetical protein [Vibrio nigripulchritudo SOn1]